MASTWHCIKTTNTTTIKLFEGKCNIGTQANIEDRKTHAIQEGLAGLWRSTVNIGKIYQCIDNQNTLLTLSGGPTGSREHLKECLEEVKILRHRGYEIKGK